jgi:hypothetical protein
MMAFLVHYGKLLYHFIVDGRLDEQAGPSYADLSLVAENAPEGRLQRGFERRHLAPSLWLHW